MRKLTLLLLICLPGLAGGQNFLSLFPDGLNDDNLEVFFGYWSLYSQNEASRTVYDFRMKTANTVFNTVFKKIYNEGKKKDPSECTEEEAEEIKNKYAGRYIVLPDTVTVYYTKLRSAEQRFSATEQELGPPVYFRPTLDSAGVRVLYLTHNIAGLLNRYLGGVFTEDKKDITGILYPHVDSLKKFIPVFYGHWGGYWHYKQMPHFIYPVHEPVRRRLPGFLVYGRLRYSGSEKRKMDL